MKHRQGLRAEHSSAESSAGFAGIISFLYFDDDANIPE
jgi:hypothetical protein